MKLLRKLRQTRGWTGFELGRRALVNPSDLSALENGRRIPPDQSPMLQRLAAALDWSGDPAGLLDEVDDGNE